MTMNRKRFKSIIIGVGIFGSCLVGTSVMSQTELRRGMNPLKQEMLALEEVFESIIDAVIFDNMELIKPLIFPFHEARKKFEQAVRIGRNIELPKNKQKFEEFIKLDDKFHKEFEILEEAAERGQKGVVQDQTHKLFDACVVCHEKFRK